ncbi:hypothetical protein hrd7_21340 [Leptolinea sp. HRD-7]|nr:hypothetical protein hrd7_21340 [Leptolinea sp. HRD-7]
MKRITKNIEKISMANDQPPRQNFSNRRDLKTLSKFDLEKLAEELISENNDLREQNANLLSRDRRFKLISKNSPDTILFQNKDLVYVWFMNSTPLLAVDQVIGKTDFEILTLDEAETYTKIKKKLLKSGGSYYKEITRIYGDLTRYFSLLFQPWRDDEGNIIGIATYFREITDQKTKEEELKRQLDGENIVSEITTMFINAEITHIEDQIPEALQKMAEYLTAEQGYIRFIDVKTNTIQKGFEWNKSGKPAFSQMTDGLPLSLFAWAKNQLENNYPIYVPDSFDIPAEASSERLFLIKAGIRSMVVLPVFVSHHLRGYIGFSSSSPHPFWSEREKALLDLFQSTIISVLERHDRENALNESRELYQKLVDFTPNGTFLFQQSKIVYSNDAGIKLLGLDSSENIGEFEIKSLLSEELLQKLRSHIVSVKEKPDTSAIDISFVNQKGNMVDVEMRAIPIKNKGEDAYLVIGVDITDRKRIEKEIENNRRFLNEILNISPLAIFVYDREKEEMAFFNPATCDLFGNTAEQLKAMNRRQIIQMVHPDDRAKAVEQQKRLANLPIGEVVEGEYRWIKLDGSTHWLHMYQTALNHSAKGTTLQSLTIVQDITDIVQTSNDLRQSEEDFRNLVDNIPGIVFGSLFDQQYKAVYLSDYFEKMTGYDKNCLLDGSINWLDITHPEDHEKIGIAINTAAQSRKPFEVEFRLKKADGTYIWVVETGRITMDENGNPVYINGIITDITARKQDFEAMRQLSQDNLRLLAQARRDAETKTLLLNEVNHRVKNNIASIIGLLEMETEREIKSPVDYQLALTDLRNRISGLAAVHDILSSSQWSPVQLDHFVRKIIENAASSSPLGRKVTIGIFSQDKNLWINARQATALGLILNELTTNAIRHAFLDKEKGTITVTIRKEEKNSNRVRLCFADDGPGWPQEILDGTGGNVGMQVMRLSVVSPLNGEIKFENHNGATAIVTFYLAP